MRNLKIPRVLNRSLQLLAEQADGCVSVTAQLNPNISQAARANCHIPFRICLLHEYENSGVEKIELSINSRPHRTVQKKRLLSVLR